MDQPNLIDTSVIKKHAAYQFYLSVCRANRFRNSCLERAYSSVYILAMLL